MHGRCGFGHSKIQKKPHIKASYHVNYRSADNEDAQVVNIDGAEVMTAYVKEAPEFMKKQEQRLNDDTVN